MIHQTSPRWPGTSRFMRALFLVVLPLLLLSGCQTAPPSRVPPVAKVPFELVGNHIFVPLRVNGAGPFNFIVDSGTSASIVDERLASELRLKHWPFSVRPRVFGGWIPAKSLRQVRFTLGGQDIKKWYFFSAKCPVVGRSVDGLLGADLFERFVVEVDYVNRELSLYEPQTYSQIEGSTELRLKRRSRLSFIEVQVGGPNGVLVPGEFLVDTGSGGFGALFVTEPFARTNHLLEVAGSLQRGDSIDCAGDLEVMEGRLPQLTLGPFTFENPTVDFLSQPSVVTRKVAGTVTTDLLRRFNVTFDYPHGRLYLAPNADFSKPFERRWTGTVIRIFPEGFEFFVSGAEMTAVAPDYNQLQVDKIIKGSSAEKSGLKQGDIVLKVDGESLASMSMERWLKFSWEDKHTHELELQRGNEILTLPFTFEWD